MSFGKGNCALRSDGSAAIQNAVGHVGGKNLTVTVRPCLQGEAGLGQVSTRLRGRIGRRANSRTNGADGIAILGLARRAPVRTSPHTPDRPAAVDTWPESMPSPPLARCFIALLENGKGTTSRPPFLHGHGGPSGFE